MIANAPSHPYARLEGAGHLAWLTAGILVVGLHAGAVGLMLMQPPDDAAFAPAGIVTVELSPIATSVREEIPDALPGKLMFEAPNTQEQAEKKDVIPDGVQLEKAPLAPEPAVVLQEAKPQPEKPEEKPPEERSDQHKTVASVGNHVTSAPQKTEAPVSETTAAPVAGNDRIIRLAEERWQFSMKARVEARKRYPQEARNRGQEGTTKVEFSIDRKGNLIGATILESSGHPNLDEEALSVLKRATPFPPPPEHMPGETVVLTLPLSFTIKRGG